MKLLIQLNRWRHQFRNWRLRTWRRWVGLCVLCGDARSPKRYEDVHTWGPYCRACNKGITFASLYGAGAQKTRDHFFKRAR